MTADDRKDCARLWTTCGFLYILDNHLSPFFPNPYSNLRCFDDSKIMKILGNCSNRRKPGLKDGHVYAAALAVLYVLSVKTYNSLETLALETFLSDLDATAKSLGILTSLTAAAVFLSMTVDTLTAGISALLFCNRDKTLY